MFSPQKKEGAAAQAEKNIDACLKAGTKKNQARIYVPIEGVLTHLTKEELATLLAKYDEVWKYRRVEDESGFNGPDNIIFTPKKKGVISGS